MDSSINNPVAGPPANSDTPVNSTVSPGGVVNPNPAMSSPPNAPVTPLPGTVDGGESEKVGNKVLMIIVIVLLLIFVSVGGYYIYTNILNPAEEETKETDSISEDMKEDGVEEEGNGAQQSDDDSDDSEKARCPGDGKDVPTGWTVFKSNHGYEIAFPAEYSVKNEIDGVGNPEAGWDPIKASMIRVDDLELSPLDNAYLTVSIAGTSFEKEHNSVQEMAEANMEKNKSNPYTYVRTVSDLEKSTFCGVDSYEFTIVSKGYVRIGLEALGAEGEIRFVFFEKSGMYFQIAYYQDIPYPDILGTFRFSD